MNCFTHYHVSVCYYVQEVNDPFKNDETSNIDQQTLDALWELGAFSLQVPNGKIICLICFYGSPEHWLSLALAI